MSTNVQMWGNSLAVRLPKKVAKEAGITQGTEVSFAVSNKNIVLKPKRAEPTLEELLGTITPENRHAEIDIGQEENELIE